MKMWVNCVVVCLKFKKYEGVRDDARVSRTFDSMFIKVWYCEGEVVLELEEYEDVVLVFFEGL